MRKCGSKSRRRTAIVAAIALIGGLVAGWQLRDREIALHAEESPEALARDLTERFYESTAGRVPLADVLGDAYQIMRTDGTRHDRDGYLAHPPSLQSYHLDRFEARRAGDILTVTFYSALTGTVEGIGRRAGGEPRLAVFSLSEGVWRLQAFANLGQGLIVDPSAAGEKALDGWLRAAASGDPALIREVLAPEFQIQRSDGSAYDAEGFLAGGIPKISGLPKVESLVATGYGDYLVTRYELVIDAALRDGKPMKQRAPRMTVFRKSGDKWLVVAHANFGAAS